MNRSCNAPEQHYAILTAILINLRFKSTVSLMFSYLGVELKAAHFKVSSAVKLKLILIYV